MNATESSAPKACIQNFDLSSLATELKTLGCEAYRAQQIVEWLYQHGVSDFASMTNLPESLREVLAARYNCRALRLMRCDQSSDGTRKALFETHDGAAIEAVLIPEPRRTTLCLSTQVGCALACSFCATGTLGFRRNLSTAEIVDQLCQMQQLVGSDQRISNIVFMGMGEPLLNLPGVLPAISLMSDPRAFAMRHGVLRCLPQVLCLRSVPC